MENYPCERYPPPALVTTSRGLCRRPRGPQCQCPYTRAKLAALEGPIFCTNTAYFLTLRQWQREQLRRRRVLIVDEAHNLEAQLVRVFTAGFAPDQMKAWFGAPLPHLASADEYRALFEDHAPRLDAERARIDGLLGDLRPPPGLGDEHFLSHPLTAEEQELLEQRDLLESVLARLRFFLDAEEAEWVVRYPESDVDAPLELQPLTVSAMAPALLWDAADVVVLSSAFMGRREIIAGYFGLDAESVHAVSSASPFAVERRPIDYRPVGVLSQGTLPE